MEASATENGSVEDFANLRITGGEVGSDLCIASTDFHSFFFEAS